jgi:serine/threonine-protein kinase
VDPERWQKIEHLYHAAIERSGTERSAFLADACGGDEDLRREVESLIAQESDTKIIDRPAGEALFESTAQQLVPGASLGQYRIVEHLGAGGMGTVYKATDTKLGRTVAIKLLRPEMLEGTGAAARFEREARALASLNHPRIAAIYGFEEHDGVRFLALEYVPGPTLAERLRRGPLAAREAIAIAKQIAEALQAAHAKGIIHRDLKPANISVSGNGDVKVLDFGLAKRIAVPTPASTDNTVTAMASLTGNLVIVGTADYMSPEQASGKEVDARTDIWSFGCVLYEALAGKRAFAGQTMTELLAAVIGRDPDWSALPESAPTALATLVKRCLRKDPAKRLRNIGDVFIELEDLLAAPAHPESAAGPVPPTRRAAIWALGGAAAGTAATAVFAISRYRGGVPAALTRFSFPVPDGDVIPSSYGRRVTISPDGSRVLYVVMHQAEGNRAYLRSLRDLEPRHLMDAMAFPFFSANGQWIGFQRVGRGRGVAKVSLQGGAPVMISPEQNLMHGTWADDDILYAVTLDISGLAAIPAAGGAPKEVLKVDFAKGERQPQSPYALSGKNTILLTMASADTETFDDARIVAFQPRTGEKRTLVEGGANPRFSRSGHLLYAHDGKILAVRFDPDQLKVSGQPLVVIEGVHMSRNNGVVNYDVSASGDLAYVPGNCDGGARSLVWVDRNGSANPVGLPLRSYLHPRLSPDGKRVAIEVEGPSHDLYVYDFDRAVLAKMTTDGLSHWPVWSPDGTQIAFRQGLMGRFKLRRAPVDRSAPAQPVTAEGVMQSAESWSPDGRSLAYTAQDPGGPAHILVASLEGGSPSHEEAGKFIEGSPKFSPDGRWVAYCSNESGKPQVYVQAYPGPGAKIQISSDGGTDPVWRRNPGEMFYRNGDSMMAVTVSTGSTFQAGRPQEIWKGHYSHGMSSSCGPPGTTSSNYDVTPDGKRFLMIKDDDQDRAISKQVVVALGWADEVTRRS